MISVHFQGKPFNITVIQGYAPASIVKEAEVEWFYEDLQDILELTTKKDVFFLIGDWNAKVGSQDIPGVTGKFGLGIQNEAGQRLTEFCQENTPVIAKTLFQQHKRRLYTVNTEIRWTIFFAAKNGEALYSQERPGANCGSDHEPLIAKFRLKMKKVAKVTRPFRYDLNQIPYNHTVGMTKRFMGLDLIECLKNYGQRFMALYRRH